MPILEWDGFKMAQSTAICNFVARKVAPHMLGETLEEQAWSDMAVAYAQDHFCGFAPRYYKWLESEKDPIEKEAVETWLPNFCQKLENFFLGKGKKFVAGDKVRNIFFCSVVFFLLSLLYLGSNYACVFSLHKVICSFLLHWSSF